MTSEETRRRADKHFKLQDSAGGSQAVILDYMSIATLRRSIP